MSLTFAVGAHENGLLLYEDLASLPHLLVAGTTGSGKSVFIHSLIADLLQWSNCRFLMIDPKRVELSMYRKSRRLLRSPIVSMDEATAALRWVEYAMGVRFTALERLGLRDWADVPAENDWPR